jgi:hypothetical protein
MAGFLVNEASFGTPSGKPGSSWPRVRRLLSAVIAETMLLGLVFIAAPAAFANVQSGSAQDGISSLAATTAPCPFLKANFRWHYSANGTSGSWSGTQTGHCGSPLTMGPQAMEGDLKVSPGTELIAGYDFTLPGNKTSVSVTVNNPQVVFTVHCVSGATPSQSTFTVSMTSHTYSAADSQWYPSGDQHSSLVYQGAIAVPDLCSGDQLRLNQGGTFTANLDDGATL